MKEAIEALQKMQRKYRANGDLAQSWVLEKAISQLKLLEKKNVQQQSNDRRPDSLSVVREEVR